METIAFLGPVRFAPAASWDTRRIGSTPSRNAGQTDSDFSATLLAMAGHDLRQPLQVITSAHDVLALTLGSEEQREELTRAADATAQLAGMLGQLVEALQLRERSATTSVSRSRCAPFSRTSRWSSPKWRGRKGLRFWSLPRDGWLSATRFC